MRGRRRPLARAAFAAASSLRSCALRRWRAASPPLGGVVFRFWAPRLSERASLRGRRRVDPRLLAALAASSRARRRAGGLAGGARRRRGLVEERAGRAGPLVAGRPQRRQDGRFGGGVHLFLSRRCKRGRMSVTSQSVCDRCCAAGAAESRMRFGLAGPKSMPRAA